MRGRCYYPSHSSYPNYGGRGIKVCDRWRESNGQGFLNFLSDMGERPKGTTLDRIDVDGNYEPDNCRWATHSDQGRNKRRVRTLQAEKDRLREVLNRRNEALVDLLIRNASHA
jgi:hypothetical protein